MYALKTIVFCFVTIKFCDGEGNIFSKLKFDVDKVGRDLENLVFDVVRKAVIDVDVQNIDQDYYTGEENEVQEEVTQHTVSRKVLNKLLENTTEISTTEQAEREITRKNSIDIKHFLRNRLKRSVEATSSNPILQNKPELNSTTINNTQTCSKTQEEHVLEMQNMQDLKQEINKLHDLVFLLKDQQKILTLLDKTSTNFDSDMTSRFDTKDLLKVLDYVNTRNTKEPNTKSNNNNEDPRGRMNTFDELEEIKHQLRETVEAMNKTREALTKERRKTLLLEKELSDQRLDLNFLKMMVKKLYKTETDFHRENVDDDILGGVQTVSQNLQTQKQIVDGLGQGEDRLQSRNSDLGALERLLKKLKQPKTNDVDSRILELEKELEKKKQKQSAAKQLKFIMKQLEKEEQPQRSRTSPDAKSEFLKKMGDILDDPESRFLDEDTELELKKLQDAIDNLQPNEDPLDFDIPQNQEEDEDMRQFQINLNRLFDRGDRNEEDDSRRFRMMLNRMFNRQSKKEDGSTEVFQDNKANRSKNRARINPEFRLNGLLLKEIVELRKQIASIEKPKSKAENADSNSKDDKPFMSGGNGKPSGTMHNPPYMPYPNPRYQNIMNPYNQYYPENIPPSNYRPREFNPQKYAETYPGNSFRPNLYNFEDYRNEDIHQTHYGEPRRPEEFNIHPVFEENLYPNNFPTSNAYQRPSPIDNQNFFRQEDRNKFFLGPSGPGPEPFYHPELPAGDSAREPEANPSKTAENEIYIYQRVEDLKTQIYNLQNVINSLNHPNYTQTLQDREVIAGLEKQIGELKGSIDNMNSPEIGPPNYVPNQPHPDQNFLLPKEQNIPVRSRRRRRSVTKGETQSDSQIFDQVVSGVKQMIFDRGNEKVERKSNYEDIQRRIDALRYQLETRTPSKVGQGGQFSPIVSYQSPYHQHISFPPSKSNEFGLFKSDKNDFFTSIVLKILDKIIAATPAVLERLFGQGLGDLSNFGEPPLDGDSYNYKVGYGASNDLQKLFKSLGFFGYGPLILLKLIDGFTTFVNILRKNYFFKTFLIPALVLLVVAGAVVFLIWWLRRSEENSISRYNFSPQSYRTIDNYSGARLNNNNYQDNSYGGNYKGYRYKKIYKS